MAGPPIVEATAVPDARSTALVLVDLQNDFLHPDGAYARGGATSPALAALPARIAPLVEVARTAGVPVVVSRFTLWPGRSGEALIDPHLAELRPFLRDGDFAPGSWGQRQLDLLGAVDVEIDKVAYSAFAHTRLEWWLRRVGIDRVVVGGIVTNGGVASTVHDAHVRGLGVRLLADGSAAFDDDVHDATVRSLASVAPALTVEQLCGAWS